MHQKQVDSYKAKLALEFDHWYDSQVNFAGAFRPRAAMIWNAALEAAAAQWANGEWCSGCTANQMTEIINAMKVGAGDTATEGHNVEVTGSPASSASPCGLPGYATEE